MAFFQMLNQDSDQIPVLRIIGLRRLHPVETGKNGTWFRLPEALFSAINAEAGNAVEKLVNRRISVRRKFLPEGFKIFCPWAGMLRDSGNILVTPPGGAIRNFPGRYFF